MAHLLLSRADPHARSALLHDDRGDRLPGSLDLRPSAEEQDAIRDVPTGDEGLRPVDDDLVALGGEASPHAGGVRAGRRFGDRQGSEPSLCDGGQEPALLLCGAEVDERLHAVEVGGEDDPRGSAGLGDELHGLEIEGV